MGCLSTELWSIEQDVLRWLLRGVLCYGMISEHAHYKCIHSLLWTLARNMIRIPPRWGMFERENVTNFDAELKVEWKGEWKWKSANFPKPVCAQRSGDSEIQSKLKTVNGTVNRHYSQRESEKLISVFKISFFFPPVCSGDLYGNVQGYQKTLRTTPPEADDKMLR